MTDIKTKNPVIILLDVETSPILGYTWEMWDARVLKVFEPSKIISVAWKELHDPTVKVKCIADYKSYKVGKVDDEQLIKDTHKVLDRADIAVAHYGLAFDFKKLAARFIYYGLPAPSPFKIVDTKRAASRYFKFDSNSLDNLGQYLGVGEKLETGGFSLWEKCIDKGDKESWDRLKKYNAQDVTLLEQIYLKLRPYIGHPNLNAISAAKGAVSKVGLSCPTCESLNVQKRGFSVTRTGKKQRFACMDCGAWSHGAFEKVTGILSSEVED